MLSKPQLDIQLKDNKKLFFASDFHLGVPDYSSSRERERIIVRWLDKVAPEAEAIILLGDMFDFWFEYKYAVPKGYIRFLGKLAQLRDQGITLYIFTGNHDMWMFDYLEKELDVRIFRHPISLRVNDTDFHIGHGDGLGPSDRTFKILKKIFASELSQRVFAALHPRWGIGLANFWSKTSRKKNLKKDESFKGKDLEWIFQYCRELEEKVHHDYYVFGHRHLPLEIPLNKTSCYYNIGEWLSARSYGVFDGHHFSLQTFEK
ncbi:MAG: UDP-2,3-diacylglucosamine diphosphatase [Cyclobacteriaceae bacterium]